MECGKSWRALRGSTKKTTFWPVGNEGGDVKLRRGWNFELLEMKDSWVVGNEGGDAEL